MKVFFKHNAIYLFLYLLLLCYLATFLLNTGKVQIHQYINSYVGSNTTIDLFFKYITELGDGLFAIFLVIILLFNNVKKAFYVLLSYSFASILTTVLKNFVFIDTWRPGFVFRYFVNQQLSLVDEVFLNTGNNTLPSGHATAAFAVFFSLLFMSKNHFLKCLFFCLAILAAFSRTYLSQHWLIDIYIGSIIGFSFSIFFYIVFYQKQYAQKFNASLQQLVSEKNKDV